MSAPLPDQSSSEHLTKEARQMAQDKQKSPFKRPVQIEPAESRRKLWVLKDASGKIITIFDKKEQADAAATAINAYSPGREKAVQGLVEAGKAACDELESYAIGRGTLRIVKHFRAALAAYEASK